MLPLDKQLATSIDQVSRALAEWTVCALYEQHPEFEERYGAEGRALWKGEILNRLQYLAEAVAADRAALFAHSVEWARAAFMARGFETGHLADCLAALDETLRAELPETLSARTSRIIAEGMKIAARAEHPRDDAVLESAFTQPGADTARARAYLVHLLERQQAKSVDVLLDAVKSGRSVAEVYESVIAPALAEVGRLWHINEATVADEHYVTMATQNAMAVLRMKLPRALPIGRRALASSVGGDLHDVGIRMVADLLESEGWQVDCLGANMPTTDLVEHSVDELGRPQFHLVALSASTGLAVRATEQAITALRTACTERRIPVMVGGGPFVMIPDLWKVVGADGCATSASQAVRVARELAG
jgi:MerR family transcriptional regulator, light-induced transcriptional regulator